MPRLESAAEKFPLPSYGGDDPAWLILDKDLPVGVLLSAMQETDQAEQTLAVVTAAIKSWNFTDTEGQAVPVTRDNVRQLRAADFLAIVKALELDKLSGLPVSEKKT
jgi:hypothetical protein